MNHSVVRCNQVFSHKGNVRRTITKMANKMATTYQCPLSWPLLLSHFYLISYKFHIWMASIELSFKFEYRFCPTNDNHEGQQNGRHLSVSAGVVTLTHFNRISSKFLIWTAFIKLWFMSEYGFCR